MAYHVFVCQVSGPNWIDSEHYDVIAKAAGPTTEGIYAMPENLLADRRSIF